jgi:hypothetical protein
MSSPLLLGELPPFPHRSPSSTIVAYLCFICASPGSTASTHSYKMKYQEYKGLYYNA